MALIELNNHHLSLGLTPFLSQKLIILSVFNYLKQLIFCYLSKIPKKVKIGQILILESPKKSQNWQEE